MKIENDNSEDLPFDVWQTSKTAIIALSVVCVFFLISLLVLGAYTAMLYAQKQKVEAIFYQVDTAARHIVRIEHNNRDTDQVALVRSHTLREYVLNREVVNHIDEKDRYKRVKLASSNKVYQEFYRLIDKKTNPDSLVFQKDVTRAIDIITDYPISSSNPGQFVHRIEFETTDTVRGKKLPKQRWVAVIEYVKSDKYVSYSDRYLNLAGIEVVNYRINRV